MRSSEIFALERMGNETIQAREPSAHGNSGSALRRRYEAGCNYYFSLRDPWQLTWTREQCGIRALMQTEGVRVRLLAHKQRTCNSLVTQVKELVPNHLPAKAAIQVGATVPVIHPKGTTVV